MTEDQRRYAHARSKFVSFVLDPAKELLDATVQLVNAATARAEETQKTMEQLRPVWAQGWSTDSEAAQASASALSEIWTALGVDNQTAAMSLIHAWPGRLEAAFLEGHNWGRSNEPVTHSAGENWVRSQTRKRLQP